MILKTAALAPHLQRQLSAIYLLIGSDHYLQQEAVTLIKQACLQRGECDLQTIQLQKNEDWQTWQNCAHHYTLFAEYTVLDLHYDKKSFDNTAKAMLQAYLQQINSRCVMIFRLPQMTQKSIQWLVQNKAVTIVQTTPLTAAALQNWITVQLRQRQMTYEATVPALIYQYSQNNMLACAQVLEKLSLISSPSTPLTAEDVKTQLMDQSEFQLYELVDHCLQGHANQAIHMVRQTKAEPILILWLLTQEIRLLIQLSQLRQQQPFNEACQHLKIWSSRVSFYEKALSRLAIVPLYTLLQQAQRLDECIKSNQNNLIGVNIEQLIVSFALGRILE